MQELILKEATIEDMIYEIRGKQVMLDSDLAKLYEVETKRINEAVKNNINKFPERFSWKVTDSEWFIIRSKFSTLENVKTIGRGKYRKYNTRVFTEQGVAMLATILKSKIAAEVSISIMDAFVAMRHYIGNSKFRLSNIETKVLEHDNEIKLLQESFNKMEEKRKVNEIYFNGQIYDAYSKILDIFKSAKEELIIIDAYSDKTILDIIRNIKVKVTIITKEESRLSKLDIDKYNSEYDNLTVYFDNTFHDRYFIVDNSTIYHCGTSINNAGSKTFSINVLEDAPVKTNLIRNIRKIMKDGKICKN